MNDDYRCCPTCGQIVLSPAQQAALAEEMRQSRQELRIFANLAKKVIAASCDATADADRLIGQVNDVLASLRKDRAR